MFFAQCGAPGPASAGLAFHRLHPLAVSARLAMMGLSLAAPWAAAETPPAAAAASASAASTLERIVVTGSPENTTEGTGSYTSGTITFTSANGLSLTPRETPQSVTVLTRQRIDDQGMSSLTDALQNTAGVSANTFDPSRATFWSRGFEIKKISTDGLARKWDIANAAGESQTHLVLFDRVEVVRGATGLLTGSGQPSASVNLVRKRADKKSFEGYAAAALGAENHRHAELDLAAPLNASRSLRARFVGSATDEETFTDLEKRGERTFYGTVDFDLTPDTLLGVGASRESNRPRAMMWGGLPLWNLEGERVEWPRSKTAAPGWSRWSSDVDNGFITLDHKFSPDWEVEASLGRSKSTSESRLNFLFVGLDEVSGLPDWLPAFGHYDTQRDETNVKIETRGRFELAGRKHEVVLGADRSHQKFSVLSYPALDGAPIGDFYQWNGAAYPEPTWDAPVLDDAYQVRETGLYGAVRMSLTDNLKLILGNRWARTDEHNTAHGTRTGEGNVTVPYLGVVYGIDKKTSAYASRTEVFDGQGYKDRTGQLLGPVTGSNLEAGVKREWFDGKLNASLAYFLVKQDNLAQPDGVEVVPGAGDDEIPEQAYYGARGTKTRGFDIELAGRLAPGWEIGASMTRFTAKDRDGVPINTFQPNRLFKLFTTYRWNRLTLGGGVNWQGRNYRLSQNPVTEAEELVEQPAYALVDLMAQYHWTDSLSLQLNVSNALDKRYYAQIGEFGSGNFGAPRSVRVTAKVAF